MEIDHEDLKHLVHSAKLDERVYKPFWARSGEGEEIAAFFDETGANPEELMAKYPDKFGMDSEGLGLMERVWRAQGKPNTIPDFYSGFTDVGVVPVEVVVGLTEQVLEEVKLLLYVVNAFDEGKKYFESIDVFFTEERGIDFAGAEELSLTKLEEIINASESSDKENIIKIFEKVRLNILKVMTFRELFERSESHEERMELFEKLIALKGFKEGFLGSYLLGEWLQLEEGHAERVAVIEVVTRAGLVVDEATVGGLVVCYGKFIRDLDHKDEVSFERAKEFYEELGMIPGFEPSYLQGFIFNFWLVKCETGEQRVYVMDQMKECGIKPDVYTMYILLTTDIKDKAVLGRIDDYGMRPFLQSIEVYNLLMQAADTYDKAEEVWSNIANRKLGLNEQTFLIWMEKVTNLDQVMGVIAGVSLWLAAEAGVADPAKDMIEATSRGMTGEEKSAKLKGIPPVFWAKALSVLVKNEDEFINFAGYLMTNRIDITDEMLEGLNLTANKAKVILDKINAYLKKYDPTLDLERNYDRARVSGASMKKALGSGSGVFRLYLYLRNRVLQLETEEKLLDPKIYPEDFGVVADALFRSGEVPSKKIIDGISLSRSSMSDVAKARAIQELLLDMFARHGIDIERCLICHEVGYDYDWAYEVVDEKGMVLRKQELPSEEEMIFEGQEYPNEQEDVEGLKKKRIEPTFNPWIKLYKKISEVVRSKTQILFLFKSWINTLVYEKEAPFEGLIDKIITSRDLGKADYAALRAYLSEKFPGKRSEVDGEGAENDGENFDDSDDRCDLALNPGNYHPNWVAFYRAIEQKCPKKKPKGNGLANGGGPANGGGSGRVVKKKKKKRF